MCEWCYRRPIDDQAVSPDPKRQICWHCYVAVLLSPELVERS